MIGSDMNRAPLPCSASNHPMCRRAAGWIQSAGLCCRDPTMPQSYQLRTQCQKFLEPNGTYNGIAMNWRRGASCPNLRLAPGRAEPRSRKQRFLDRGTAADPIFVFAGFLGAGDAVSRDPFPHHCRRRRRRCCCRRGRRRRHHDRPGRPASPGHYC
jgi:hypothetical protein